MSETAKEFNALVKMRRSVFPKFYTGEAVNDEIVMKMLENATYAPTHKLTEPWRFIVFSGNGIAELAAAQAGVYKSVTEKDGTFNEDTFQKLQTKPLLSSHIIVVCMKRDPKKSVPEMEEAGAVFCAIQNMYLTATAYNVGCYLSTGGITYMEEARKIFELGTEDRLIGFLHVGMPKQQMPESKRKPVESISEWVR